MKEIISTLTSKGRVTIPAEIRKYLGITSNDKIGFVIDDEGQAVYGIWILADEPVKSQETEGP